MKKLALVVVVVAFPAFAAGFRIDDQSARWSAMGSAVSSLVDDAAANYYNPAGLTKGGQGFSIELGDTLIIPQVKFTPETGESTNTLTHVSPPFHAYVRAGLIDQLAIGVGVFTGYGASAIWPEDWPGQFKARESNLQTFTINPNIAYSPFKRFSLGFGVDVVRGTIVIERHLDFVDSIGSVELGGGAWGVGFNGGAQVEIIEDVLYAGTTVRGPVDLNFTGRAHFEGIPVEFQKKIYDQGVKAHLQLPLTAQFGLGFKPFKALRFGLDVTYVDWSSFKELRIEFENPDLTNPLPKNWWDTASFHVGGELDVTDSFRARLGFVYDPTPSPSETLTPDLPDSTRLKFAVGVGYHHSSGIHADLSLTIVALLGQKSIAVGFPGTYTGTAEIVALTVGYTFPTESSTAAPAEETKPPEEAKPPEDTKATPDSAPPPESKP